MKTTSAERPGKADPLPLQIVEWIGKRQLETMQRTPFTFHDTNGPQLPFNAWNDLKDETATLTRKPSSTRVETFYTTRPIAQFPLIQPALSRSFYRLSLQVKLQGSPIKASCKSLDLCSFSVHVWEDRDDSMSDKDDDGGMIIVALYHTGGDSLLFCNYATAILSDLKGESTVEEDLIPFQYPRLSMETKQPVRTKEDPDVRQRAEVMLNHVRGLMLDEVGCLDRFSTTWLRELMISIAPKTANANVALAARRMLATESECADIRNKLFQTAFQSAVGDSESDTIYGLMALALMFESIVAYKISGRPEAAVREFSHAYKMICLENVRHASVLPHIAYASVKLIRALAAYDKDDNKILGTNYRQDAVRATLEALDYARLRHATLETECSCFVSETAISLPPAHQAVAESTHQSFQTISATKAVDRMVYPNLRGLLAEPSTETLKLHDELRGKIQTLDSVDACSGLYDSSMFQECTRLLRTAQITFIEMSAKPSVEAKEEWARHWAAALSRNEDWALALNLCKETALMLLYKVCDLCCSMDPPRPDLVSTEFQTKRINQILYPGVVMDRANCLHNMRNCQTDKIGLGWYADGDEDDYKVLRDPPLPLNPEGPTINERLRWLQTKFYPDDVRLNHWLTVHAPLSLHTA